MTTQYKIVYENQLGADSPLQAAQDMFNALKNDEGVGKCFHVTNLTTGEVFSVDIDEPDEDAVQKI